MHALEHFQYCTRKDKAHYTNRLQYSW